MSRWQRLLAARRENVLSAFRSIRDNKLRSFLTCLGIIIGVATVIVMVALIDGFNSQFIASFQSFGATMDQLRHSALTHAAEAARTPRPCSRTHGWTR